jgi:hypothetical protein
VELGDGDAEPALVAFAGDTGAVHAAAPSASRGRRRAAGRRGRRRAAPALPRAPPDAFARWLLTFGGDARPVAPASLVDGWRDLARRTRAVYAGGSA